MKVSIPSKKVGLCKNKKKLNSFKQQQRRYFQDFQIEHKHLLTVKPFLRLNRKHSKSHFRCLLEFMKSNTIAQVLCESKR